MKHRHQVKRFSSSIINLSKDNEIGEELLVSFKLINSLLKNNSSLRSFIQIKRITQVEKFKILHPLLKGSIHPIVIELLSFLNGPSCLIVFKEVMNTFGNWYLGDSDRVLIEATFSQKATKKEMDALTKYTYSKKNAKIIFKEDPSIIGGFKLKINNTVFDNSIQSKLKSLKSSLLNH